MKFVLFQCWIHPDCKTVGEAINNPRLTREIARFDTKDEAERYKKTLPTNHFVYWIDKELNGNQD